MRERTHPSICAQPSPFLPNKWTFWQRKDFSISGVCDMRQRNGSAKDWNSLAAAPTINQFYCSLFFSALCFMKHIHTELVQHTTPSAEKKQETRSKLKRHQWHWSFSIALCVTTIWHEHIQRFYSSAYKCRIVGEFFRRCKINSTLAILKNLEINTRRTHKIAFELLTWDENSLTCCKSISSI